MPGRIGQYELRREIGTGGMGAVYEAFHPRLEKRVAIKVLHKQLAIDSALVGRFLDEGRAASRIRHPHVVDITDVGAVDNVPYLVMELLEGESLAARIAREAPMSPAAIVDVLLPVCSALEAAHGMRVLHRDLKPENVFLARIGTQSLPHPKIVDFGLAKVHDPVTPLARTDRTHLMGTPYYMSVEQVRNPIAVDERTDIYALGVIAYEALTGKRPFEGELPFQVLAAVVNADLVPPRSVVPAIPPELDAIVLRAMARDRGQRFATARELAVALLPFASDKARFQWASAFGLASVAPPPMEAPRAPRTGPPCILVIEDDEAIRENLVELLELEGYLVRSAARGDDGLALAREGGAHLVLCDVSMPGLSGHEVLRAIRADAAIANVAFVFLTGNAEQGDVRAGMKLGADDYLTKPFTRDDLLDAVRVRLARSAARDVAAIPPAPRVPVAHAPTLLMGGDTPREGTKR